MLETSFVSVAGTKLQGNELYPKSGLQILTQDWTISFLATVSAVLAVYVYFKNRKKSNCNNGKAKNEQKKLLTLYAFFMLFIIFGFGAWLLSGRFFDYFILVTPILFFTISELLLFQGMFVVKRSIARWAMCYCFVFFFCLGIGSYLKLQATVSKFDYEMIKYPMEWIRDNSEDREMVYLFDWSNFPLAFFYNDKNIYSWGMEPRELERKNPELYWKAYNIMAYKFYCEEQRDCEDELDDILDRIKKMNEDDRKAFYVENSRKIIESIRHDFGARFVLSLDDKFTNTINYNKDLIEDQIESISKKNEKYKVTAFKLK